MGRDGTRAKNDFEGILRVFLKRGKNALADGTAAVNGPDCIWTTCYGYNLPVNNDLEYL